MMNAPIPFIDLKAQRDRIRDDIDAAIFAVVDRGDFILGREVAAFETALAGFTGAKHVIGCANGTDALQLALMAEGIAPGDAVLVPAFTFVATAESVAMLGATPVFVDVLPDTYNIDPASLDVAIGVAKAEGLHPRAVIPVDLFGQPADYDAIAAVVDEHGLVVIADAAQSLGGHLSGQGVGTLAPMTTTSFFPAKPLGCYGDGGAILTDDENHANFLRSLRVHGKGGDKYDNVRVGMNSRLDTVQAAILLAKLSVFADELEARERVAQVYSDSLRDKVRVPALVGGATSAWAQYTIQVEDRDRVQAELKSRGIPTAVYYPRPLTAQTGYRDFPKASAGVPVSEALSERVLSLPMHPYLDAETQARIVTSVLEVL